MKISQRSQNQIRWIVIAFGIVALIGVGWWITLELGLYPLSTVTEESQPSPQHMENMAGRKMKTMPDQSDKPSVRPAPMVSSFKQQMIGVQTALVEKHRLSTTVRATGRVTYNEQRIANVNLRISGWIKDLYVDFTGKPVRKGQPLFTLYSPELVATQEEYLLALQALEDIQASPLPDVHQQAQQVLEAARDRLRLWTFTDDQIDELELQRTPSTSVTIFSPITGHIIDKTAVQGMFVRPDMTMYTIANLSKIWVLADVFEYELPFVQVNQPGTFTLEAFPGETFSGHVSYIYPYLTKETRTVQVRLEFPNPQVRLKPDMYGTVLINVKRAPSLAIPAQAVLDSGHRQVVFVAQEKGRFEPREVTLGPKVGSFFEVNQGLKEGERIVTSGTFLLDSESRLLATSNMMGVLGMGGVKMEQAQMGKMNMGNMEMSGMNMKMDVKKGKVNTAHD